MDDSRTYLQEGTTVTLESGDIYRITGAPVGCGGGSVIYPVERLTMQQGQLLPGGIFYVLKECYPVSSLYPFVRDEKGEIVPASGSDDAANYLSRVKEMQAAEKEVTQQIYRTASRLLPILDSSGSAKLTFEGRTATVHNVYTVMESLASKGRSLSDYVEEYGHLPTLQAFHIVRQILFALREIHQGGYLHLDIQGGNIFIKGTLADESDILTLIDFGSARKLTDGKTAPVADRVIFTTRGFTAPEILLHNDGTLCLTPGADIYSVGCLLLFMLTGERYDTRQLVRNTTGRYLTNFKLRKIDCPRHLVERMQRIIARALAADPGNRYRSADQMLSEVSDLIKALRPKETAIGAVAYDAFVCYRHGRIDSSAALALQKNLEHFRPPRGILRERGVSAGRPFRRVFVDEGELSSCADLGGQIREALKNSAWLIVVCSPATPGSPWVAEEIETFLQYHDRSRILAVLTEGEPEEAFPGRLLAGPRGQTEVLAADARGKSLGDILKKLRGDALLKLAAPMLGTTYDSLKQRHKMRLLQQVTAAACLLLAFAGAFSAYAVRQSHRIREELTRTQISESRFLAKQSEEELAKGQRFDAIRTALSALPESSADQSRPVVPEAVAALKSATYAYRKAYPDNFFLRCDIKPDSLIGKQDLTVSPDGMHLAGVDYSGALFICETEKGKLLFSAHPSDIDSSDDSSAFIEVRFLDDSRLLLLSAARLHCFDISAENLLWSSGFPKPEYGEQTISEYNCSGMTITKERDRVYFMNARSDDLELYAYDCEDGKLCEFQKWDGDLTGYKALSGTLTELILSPDDETALIGTADTYLRPRESQEPSLFVISLDTMEIRAFRSALPHVVSLCFSGNSEAAVLSCVESKDGHKYDCTLEMLRLSEMDVVWTSQYSAIGSFDTGYKILMPDPASSSGDTLLWACGSTLIFIESVTGKVKDELTLTSSIIDVEGFGPNSLVVCQDDGSICELLGYTHIFVDLLEASGSYSAAYKKPSPDLECEFFLKDASGNGVIVVGNTAEDPSYTELDLSSYEAYADDRNSSFSLFYIRHGDTIWRGLPYADNLLLYKIGTDVPVASIPVKSLDNLPGFKDSEEAPVLYYTNSNILNALNLDTSENLLSHNLPDTGSLFGWTFLGWQEDTIVFFDKFADEEPCLYLFNTRTLEGTPVYAPENEARVYEAAFSSQCGFIAAIVTTYVKPDELWFYDIASGSWHSSTSNTYLTKRKRDTAHFSCDGQMALSPDGRTLALVSSGNIVIIDTADDTILGTLNISCLQDCAMQFIDDKKLAVWDDTNYISIWDTAERTMLSRTAKKYSGFGCGFIGNPLETAGRSFLQFIYNDGRGWAKNEVYSVDESGKILPYLSLSAALMADNAEEICYVHTYGGEAHAGYYKPYTLDELIRRGHELIGDP